ncbi:glycosyltransferase family 2 protein [Thermococcus sp. 21S9]|uniref:glycosyltransferase family 2 protein n=1 Tax=Thermococcus sp. 21S9 TaxID=1638223 RepID=UPI001F0DCB45|nr:glycosyltransferase family 2 protein [Thermococcus sp. 21S9]
MPPRVSIIILNWKNWGDTIECLESVYRLKYTNYDVIIVDNGSDDESVTKIKEYARGNIKITSDFFKYSIWNKPIKVFELDETEARVGRFNKRIYEKYDPDRRMIIIRNHENYGYAGGNNTGIKFALSVLSPKYILILNNDTVIAPDLINKLVKVAEQDNRIGIVGPRVNYYNYLGHKDIVQYCGSIFKILFLRKQIIGHKKKQCIYKNPIDTDEVYGACMLIKENILYDIGLFDENFFAYWEETDMCFNTKKQGYILKIVPGATIWHKIGSNNDSEKRVSILASYLFGRNMIYFTQKNLNGITKFVNLLYILTLKTVTLWLIYVLHYANPIAAISFTLGILKGIKNERGKPCCKLFNSYNMSCKSSINHSLDMSTDY